MAAADGAEDNEQEAVQDERDKQRAEQMKAMDRMTDLVPEKQLDEGKVKKAMEDLDAAQKASKEAQRQREKELAAVKVTKEDIDIIALEFEIDKKAAERRLRECNGDLHAALKSLL